jgi:hypothetical protein
MLRGIEFLEKFNLLPLLVCKTGDFHEEGCYSQSSGHKVDFDGCSIVWLPPSLRQPVQELISLDSIILCVEIHTMTGKY